MKRDGRILNGKGKEANLKNATHAYDSNSMTFWKRQNRGESKKISGCQGFMRVRTGGEMEGGMNTWNAGDF